ncbi:MAG: hypothetical protein NTU79_12040 [Planctomycetota bacterium]|nr:hypothetical protein [Planctomycetota bacterium]
MNPADLESVDEQLTAYLDGELSAEEASRIENRLVDDEGLRVRLAELRKAYDLLDELPETPHNQRFTRSTLELVIKDLSVTQSHVVHSIVKPTNKADWWALPRVLILVGLFVVTGITSGFALRLLKTNQELRDLGLIAGLPGMSGINELSIAIKLSEQKAAIDILKSQNRDRLVPAVPKSIAERKAWIENLTPLQIGKLANRREALDKLDRDTYARLSSIESQIENRPDSEQIQETIHVIGLVLDSFSSADRSDLDVLNQDQKTAYLKEKLCFAAARVYATQISPEDAKALDEWNNKFFRPALLEELQPTRSFETKDLLSTLWSRRLLERGFQMENQSDLVASLAQSLSDTGRSLLEGVSKNDQLKVLSSWLDPSRTSSTQMLIEAYDKMDRDFRERLDLADPQQTRRNVEEFILRSRPRGNSRP